MINLLSYCIDRTKYTNDLTNVDLINNRLNFNY